MMACHRKILATGCHCMQFTSTRKGCGPGTGRRRVCGLRPSHQRPARAPQALGLPQLGRPGSPCSHVDGSRALTRGPDGWSQEPGLWRSYPGSLISGCSFFTCPWGPVTRGEPAHLEELAGHAVPLYLLQKEPIPNSLVRGTQWGLQGL